MQLIKANSKELYWIKPPLSFVFCVLVGFTTSGAVRAGISCTTETWYWRAEQGGQVFERWTTQETTCSGTPDIERSGFMNRLDGGGGAGGAGGAFRGNKADEASQKEKACGNPIVASTGNKTEAEVDFTTKSEAGLFLKREYNKYWNGVGLFGKQWISNFDYKLTFGAADVNACYPRPGGGTCGIGTNTIIFAHRPDARAIKFVKNTTDGIFYEDKLNPVAKIVHEVNGTFTLYSEDNDVERYSSAGYVAEVKSETGVGWTFGYSGTYPIRVTHTSGRYVDLVWTSGQLTSVRDPAGNYYGFAYLANRFGAGLHLLSATTRPGTPSTAIAYHYEDTRFPGALTGKSFGGIRYSYFTYSVAGRAVSSEHGGGRDRYTFNYIGTAAPNERGTDVTNPLGLTSQYTFVNGGEVAENRLASTNCPGALRYKTLDANNNIDLVQDFRGNVTDYDYNAKGQLLKKVEGAGTPEARATDLVWDTSRNRILSVAVAGHQKTAMTYTPDNRLASVTQTNLSANGVANQSRTTTYAYTNHSNGMLASVTVDGPVAGSGDTITRTYNTSGDLVSIANSLGHAVTYSNHNGLGLPGRVTGPNGDITDFTYDAQGRVVTKRLWISGNAADTNYVYDAKGLLASKTTPDGVVTNYEYDTARRLTRIWRAANGTVAGGASKEDQLFTYDLMGNITRIDHRKLVGQYETQCLRWMTIEGVPECVQETQIYVEVPTITKTMLATYDDLGRLKSRTGAGGQNFRHAYDANGNLTSTTDSLNRTTSHTYDALNRRVSTTDPNNGITRFEYDAGDRINKIIDARNVSTTYVLDGFGQPWAVNSPDTGVTTFQYNASGQRTYMTRPDGSGLAYSYDSLGRLSWYGTSVEGRAIGYDWCMNGKGRVCEANYGDGSRHYGYTPQGQIAVTRDFTAGLVTDDWTGYSYDNSGNLTGISYPSGVSAGYAYSHGKLTTMTATINGQTQVVAGGINYQPFDGVDNWTYGNNYQRLIQRDLDGRLTAIHTSGLQGLFFDYNSNNDVTRIANSVNPGLTQTFGYDPLGRLTSAFATSTSSTFAYDLAGNRTSQSENGTAWAYNYAAGSNRLVSTATPGLTRSFNSNGLGNVSGWVGLDGAQNVVNYDGYQHVKSHTKNGIATNYRFNAHDQRVLKTTGGGSVSWRYVYTGQNQLLAEKYSNSNNGTSQWTTYLWLGNQPVGLVKGTTLYWVHADHLGRPEVVTNSGQQVVWRAANYAFGRNVTTDAIAGYNLGFPGQYWDSESNLWHNGMRDYEPTIGRYLQSDPIGLAGGVSPYNYVDGNPIIEIDPLGLQTAIILGGETRSNPFGHMAIAFSGRGVFSYGTNTPLGSSLTAYLRSQATYRASTVIIIDTTPEQEAKMMAKILEYKGKPLPDPMEDLKGAWKDTCATRTQSALEAGGITSIVAPVNSPFPTVTAAIGAMNASDFFVIFKGGEIPGALSEFDP